ncbi:MAG: spore cortex biosynthesis protein YabQ [Clostridiales bacterium]|nr:spore cortex biosynthesis protein YabQ [Clostridiales bacterium]
MDYEKIAQQAQLFLLAAVNGGALLLLYDLLRIFRRVCRHRMAWMAAEDLLFWLLGALWMFGFMHRFNEGVIRGFIILGAAAGMFLYAFLFSRWVVCGGTAVLSFLCRVVRRVVRFATAPLRFLFRLWGGRMRIAAHGAKKSAGYLKKRVKKAGKAVRIGLRKF